MVGWCKELNCWAPVAHACNPGYSRAEIRRIAAQSQLRQILYETLSQKKVITKTDWWSGLGDKAPA
jgi:hypothetical protein